MVARYPARPGFISEILKMAAVAARKMAIEADIEEIREIRPAASVVSLRSVTR